MKPQSIPTYSRLIGCVYIFNLIVGTGALAMPKAFKDAGWLFSVVALFGLCFLSFITTTFVIETMSISNGLMKICKLKYVMKNDAFNNDEIEDSPFRTLATFNSDSELNKRNYGTESDSVNGGSQENLVDTEIIIKDDNNSSLFEINEVYEMGKMAMTYFNRLGLVLFYLVICIYLYGDLAVYAASVPLSIRDVACTYQIEPDNSSYTNSSVRPVVRSLNESDLCWPNANIDRMDAYRIFLTIFVILLCPFVFFNLSKTKLLQISTLAMRWFAFGIMFILMGIFLSYKSNTNSLPTPPIIDIRKSPNFFGICVYSFMCHHSLPSLVTPIRNKSKLLWIFLFTFILILMFYIVLCLLSTFSFIHIADLITLNFEPSISAFNDNNDPLYQKPITNIAFFQYYLTLFPVFSLSATFPILAITLRNNLKNLITCGSGRQLKSEIIDRILYPLLALVPPIIVVYTTHNVQSLVGFTGSYGGSIIQYVIPACLVLIARRHYKSIISKLKINDTNNQDNNDSNTPIENVVSYSANNNCFSEIQIQIAHESPFKHPAWAYMIIAWAGITIIFVTTNHIMTFIKQ